MGENNVNTVLNLLTLGGFFYVMFRGFGRLIGDVKKLLRGGGHHREYVDSTDRDVTDERGTDTKTE